MHELPPNPLAKPGYILQWHDEFDTPDLDTRNWLPYYLPHWSSRERTAPRYRLEDGALTLYIDEEQPPWCPEFDGDIKASSLQTGLFAGPPGSSIGQLHFNPALVVREAQTNVRLYTPRYGYFECRARAASTSGNHVSLYMIGYEETPDQSAEIAMFEIFGSEVNPASAIVRYGVHPWADPTLADEFYHDPFDIDVTDYHIYAHEWTPTHVDFYLDNQKIRRIHQSPAYLMQIMLAIYELPGGDTTAPYPKEFIVDYVRAYQPEGGY